MTRDNEGYVDPDTGNPGPNLEPSDVIKCRECGNMVRRVNRGHLQSDRCRYTDPKAVRTGKDDREDLLRPDHPETVGEYEEKYPDAPRLSPALRKDLRESAIDDEVSERRRELTRRMWRGEDPGDVYDRLEQKYDTPRGTLRYDWSTRSEWMGRVFGLEDAEAVVMEALAEKNEVRSRLKRLARRAEDTNDVSEAVRALKAADSSLDETIEHLRDLGRVASADSTHKVEVEGSVEHDHTHGPAGDRLPDETLEQLDALTGGADADVVDAKFERVDDEDEDG